MTRLDHPDKKLLILPARHRQTILDHCRRKLSGRFLAEEEQNRKAYGLLAGETDGELITVKACLPLLKNARSIEPHRGFMDRMMQEHAIESETPLAKRGWVADPAELTGAVSKFKTQGFSLIGSYHMHRVAWEHDKERDTPTTLDTVLGTDSRLIMMIISMVDPNQPTIRAFYEGREDREIPITIIDEVKK
ncbi:MAG: hypothetical protein RQ753_03875 [Desulfurivibrionaceae bacterium]|nr:hypothetical protein [Desulfobulbales bacterium]MDT8334814.1 hypothetical protein [Desulfurivibrionaceae bacterium]